MKKTILAAAAALLLPFMAHAGEIAAGSTPRSINYQGRLERDNAPITGTIHLYFRVYNHLTANGAGTAYCGNVNQPCLWQSAEMTVEATQGVFSANLEFTEAQLLYVFSGASQKYLEVQVESDVLAPREPINSVVFAMVAKKLEDGASVNLSTLTVGYQVLLATHSYAKVGIGTNSPTQKLTIDGGIELRTLGNGITFPNGTVMTTAGVGSAVNGVTSDDFVTIRAANVTPNTDIVFNTPASEIARMTYAGDMGIGTPTPAGKLEVDGSLIIGTEGLSDRDDGVVNINEDLDVAGGNISGTGANYLSIGETADTIIAGTGGSNRLWLDSSGNLGAGTAAPASERVYASGNVRATAGVRGSNVSMGAYNNTWTGLANEVRAADGTDLLLQQSNPYYVGIGTNTPREKLHVRGTVLADYGVRASTALFTSNVNINGDFTANGSNKNVYLTSTTIYGTLTVSGGVASEAGFPAYVASSNTFTGQNTFMNQLVVSSDIVTVNRIGAAVTDFDFPGGRYLQVGDNKVEYSAEDTSAYLVGGSGANAKLQFYRGPTQAAVLQTQGGRNLAVVVEGQARTLTDAYYHRIQNAALWVSTGYASTPGIFVSSMMGNVGMGTTVMDPNWKLTVEGNLRISTASSPGQSYGIIFADGTMLNTAGGGSASSIANNSDAVIQSDSDQSGSGSVLLRAGSLDGMILTSGGNVGIGTVNPLSKLNVRGGDLVLGTPAITPYNINNTEDLIVGGNTVFDGALIQRSAAAVELANLIVANSVYLSTAAGARTAIGSDTLSPNPNTRLYVKGGDINLDLGKGLRVNEAAPLRYYLRGNDTRYEPSLIIAQDIPASIARTTTTITLTAPLTGTGDLSDNRTFGITGLSTLGTANYLPGTNAAGTGWEYKQITGAANEIDITHSAGGVQIGIVNPLIVGKGGTGAASFTANGVLYGDTANPLNVTAAGTQYEVLRAGAGGTPAFGSINLDQAAAVTGVLPLTNGGTGGLLTTTYGGTGANLSAGTIGDIPYFSAAGVIGFVNNGTANYLLQANGAVAPSWVESTSAATGNTIVRRDANGDFSANIITANGFNGTIAGGSSYIYDTVSVNDYIRVRGFNAGGTNNGYLEIATADDGTEPIYVRQYNNLFAAALRTLTLLDASGDSYFPRDAHFARYVSADHFNMTGSVYATNPNNLVGEWGDGYLRYVLPSNVTVGAASALGADGTDCAAGSFARGIDASGNAELCETSITGNAGTVTNGVYNNGSYSNPAWITALAASKISGQLGVGNGGTGADLSATGAANMFVKQLTAGGAFSVSAITDANVPDTITLTNITQITNRAITDLSGTLAVSNGGTGITAAGATGKVVCWKSATQLGVCSNAPDGSGVCTCN